MQLSNKSFLLITLLSAVFFLHGCGDDPSNPFEVTYNPPEPFDTASADTSYTTDQGLEVYVIEEGDGLYEVESRDQISAYYTGRRIQDGQVGEVFESTYRNDVQTPGILRNLTPTPIQNPSGGSVSPLIEGFRKGITGLNDGSIPPMRAGEKRVVIIPPALGYGDSQEGTNGFDLRNDTLRFDIELDEIL